MKKNTFNLEINGLAMSNLKLCGRHNLAYENCRCNRIIYLLNTNTRKHHVQSRGSNYND